MPVVNVMGHTLEVSGEAEEALVRPLVALFDHILYYIPPAAAQRFLEIYEQDASGQEYVVSADFQRHSPDHRLYRELRHNLLIRPRAGGQWEPGTRVEVCVFSHMLYAHAAQALRDKVARHAAEHAVAEKPAWPAPAEQTTEVSR